MADVMTELKRDTAEIIMSIDAKNPADVAALARAIGTALRKGFAVCMAQGDYAAGLRATLHFQHVTKNDGAEAA